MTPTWVGWLMVLIWLLMVIGIVMVTANFRSY